VAGFVSHAKCRFQRKSNRYDDSNHQRGGLYFNAFTEVASAATCVSRQSPRKACEEFPLLHVPQAAGRFAAPRRSVPPILVGQSLQRRGPECYALCRPSERRPAPAPIELIAIRAH
jgi:hypothetical protein